MWLVWLVLPLHLHYAFGQPTTPFIQEVFIGKCYTQNPQGNVNCGALWTAFSSAASMNPALNATAQWDQFFDIASFDAPENLTLFWSGSKDFSALLSTGGRYTTLEQTSAGYVLNQLWWCGNQSSQFDYVNSCSYQQTTTNYGMDPVWRRASLGFAKQASGTINILLSPAKVANGSNYQAFRDTSILATVELPSMNNASITGARVLVLQNYSWPEERCGSGSLDTLDKALISMFKFSVECIDDPSKIVDIICESPYDQSSECVAARLVKAQEPIGLNWFQQYGIAWAVAFVVVAVLLLISVVYFSITQYRHRASYTELEGP